MFRYHFIDYCKLKKAFQYRPLNIAVKYIKYKIVSLIYSNYNSQVFKCLLNIFVVSEQLKTVEWVNTLLDKVFVTLKIM